MIRNLLVLLVFLGIGFAANVAQSDIFVRQSPKEEKSSNGETKKKSIFLRPFSKRSQEKKASGKSRYGAALDTSGLRRETVKDLKRLAYWQQSGRKPETVEEMWSYSVALRAKNQALMIRHMEAGLPRLVALEQKREERFRQRREVQAKKLAAVRQAKSFEHAKIREETDKAEKQQRQIRQQEAALRLQQKHAETHQHEHDQKAVVAVEQSSQTPPQQKQAEASRKKQQIVGSAPRIFVPSDKKNNQRPQSSKSDPASRVYRNYR